MPADPTATRVNRVPGLTACSLCAGETLGDSDPLPGGQMERLRRLTREDLARLTLVECLDECNRGDVVVVRPAPGRRRAGTTPVWFERLAGDRATGALATWLREGGPSAGPPPAQLAHLVINRPGPGDDDQSAVRSAQSTTTTT